MATAQQQSEGREKDVAYWKCPFCAYTDEKERSVRSHIESSGDDEDDPHMGVSGWDVVLNGYNEEEELVVGGDDVDIQSLTKKDRIINAILADPQGVVKNKIKAEVTDATGGYVSSLSSQINTGEISESELEETRNEKVIEEIRRQYNDKLEQPLEKLEQEAEESETTEATETTEDTMQESKDLPGADLTKKDRIINAILADPYSVVKNKFKAEIADATEGYVSNLSGKLSDGDFSEDELNDIYDEDLANEMRDWFDSQLESSLEELEAEAGEIQFSIETLTGGKPTETTEEVIQITEEDEEEIERRKEEPVEHEDFEDASSHVTLDGESVDGVESLKQQVQLMKEMAEFDEKNAVSDEDRRNARTKIHFLEWFEESLNELSV